jgi:hypothetical protein
MGSPWLPVVSMRIWESGKRDIGYHGSSIEEHLSVELTGKLYYLLDTMNIAGKNGNDDPSRTALEYLAQGVADISFRKGVACTLDIGGIGHKGQNPFFAIGSEAGHIEFFPIYGGVVYFEIP